MHAQIQHQGILPGRQRPDIYLMCLAVVVAIVLVTRSDFFLVSVVLTALFLLAFSIVRSHRQTSIRLFEKARCAIKTSSRATKVAAENRQLRSLVEQLEASEAALRIANAPGAIREMAAGQTRHAVVITNPNGLAEYVNDAFTQLTGYSAQNIVGRNPWALLQGEKTNLQTVDKVRHALELSKSVNVEILHYSRDGQPYWAWLDIEPILSNAGELLHFIGTQFDISEQKENELNLQESLRHSEAANRAKSEFLANMSREIRTPLNGILGFTEVLRRGVGDPKQRRMHLDTIHSSGQHLMLLINDILDVSEIEAGRMVFERSVCSPHEIVCEVLTKVRDKANDKGISLECYWSGEIPALIKTDPDRLHQLLLNLVSNAIKFTDHGGVEVRIEVDSNRTPDSLVMEVCDSGRGISSDDIEKIFAPFNQSCTSMTRSFGGTGLGLAISRHIAKELGGSVSAQSTLGEGSIFRATIDPGVGEAALDAKTIVLAQRSPQIEISDEFACLKMARILICDNDRTNCELVQLILDESGADIYAAPNHQTLVDLISESPEAYDLVMIDLQLPVGDGTTSIELLRNSGWQKPVIALVPHSRVDSHLSCVGDECDGVLTKPVDFDELLEVVRKAVSSVKTDTSPFEVSGQWKGIGKLSSVENWPIHPTLPSYQPSLQVEIEDFVASLDEFIQEMQLVLDRGDMKHLVECAQWLRSTSENMGFDCFALPSRSLELAARSGTSQKAQKAILEIQAFAMRIELPWRDASRQETAGYALESW